MHLRSSPEWVARCWDGLLPAGRNVCVSMMVECFGIYMFVLTFLGFGYMRRGTYLCFGAGMSLFSCLVSGWGSLWLLSCGWFVALSSCRSVLLHC